MNERYMAMDRSRSVESVRLLRLRGLLRDEVRREGPIKTSERLGVNYKTVARALESGNLTPRLSEALEMLLICGGTPAMVWLRERVDGLEERVEAMSGRLDGLATTHGVTNDEVGDGQEEAREEDRAKTETPALFETPNGPGAGGAELSDLDPLVVSEAAVDGEEGVYGAAWPLIVEWRWLRDGHPHKGRSLAWLGDEERILLLELALLEEYGLTLPPEIEPLRGFGRYGQINWRRTALRDTHKARIWRQRLRWLRRVLTVGIWWR